MPETNLPTTEAGSGVVSISTTDLEPSTGEPVPAAGNSLYPAGIPQPQGAEAPGSPGSKLSESPEAGAGTGTEGEVVIWQARYSKLNFVGRTVIRLCLTVAWLFLANYTWNQNHAEYAWIAWLTLAVVGYLWVSLGFRMVQAHYSHYYRLTNRRLFVSTGVIHRRRDMLELLRIKDVFTRQQSLMERWIGLGTVVVVPTEKELPTFYVAGVKDPKQVMDLIWHHARSERDLRSVKVDSV